MKLIDLQIEGTKKTLAHIIEEHLAGEPRHKWYFSTCHLCQLSNGVGCGDCPLKEKFNINCLTIARTVSDHVSLQDIAGFLQSLLITLELMKEGK